MIYPTRAAALAAAAGAPVALVVAVALPARWYVALAWPTAVLLLVIADAWLGAHRAAAELTLPDSAPVGAEVALVPPTRTARPRRAIRSALSCSNAVYCRIGQRGCQLVPAED